MKVNKRKIFHNNFHCPRRPGTEGMTLIELVIAAVLVTIVLAGALSVEYSLRTARKTASQDALLAMRTSAVMSQLTRDAALATGDARYPGMIDYEGGFCFRQDLNDPQTPGQYGDDSWACYMFSPPSLYRCVLETDPGMKEPLACASPGLGIDFFFGVEEASAMAGPSGPCELSDPVVGSISDISHTIAIDSTKGIYIDLTVTGFFNPYSAEDPVSNPKLTLKTRVYPIGHGF